MRTLPDGYYVWAIVTVGLSIILPIFRVPLTATLAISMVVGIVAAGAWWLVMELAFRAREEHKEDDRL